MMIIILVMVGLMLWMSYSGKKARAAQESKRESVIAVGNAIMTTSGFYGTIVDIDGDAITLQSPAGEETVWDRRAIAQLAELPLAAEDADESLEEDAHVEAIESEEKASDAETPAADENPSSPFSN